MAQGENEPADGMSSEAYERLVLLAARRRRGQPSEELEEWVRADPAAAETVELMERAGRGLDAELARTAPSAEHVASQKVSILARIQAKRRARRVRRAIGLSVTAGLVLAIILLWAVSGCRPGGADRHGLHAHTRVTSTAPMSAALPILRGIDHIRPLSFVSPKPFTRSEDRAGLVWLRGRG